MLKAFIPILSELITVWHDLFDGGCYMSQLKEP